MRLVYTLEYSLSRLNQEEFKILIDSSKRSNKLFEKEIKSLIYYPYGLVKIELPELLKNLKLTEIIKKFFVVSDEKIAKQKHKDLFAFIVWIKDELEAIYKLEKDYLSSPPDNDLINAGVNELDQLGEICVIDNLAGGDILKWEKIKKLPYHQVFDKLRKNNIEAKISKAYHKIISQKQKRKA